MFAEADWILNVIYWPRALLTLSHLLALSFGRLLHIDKLASKNGAMKIFRTKKPLLETRISEMDKAAYVVYIEWRYKDIFKSGNKTLFYRVGKIQFGNWDKRELQFFLKKRELVWFPKKFSFEYSSYAHYATSIFVFGSSCKSCDIERANT